MTDPRRRHMERAVELAQKCKQEPNHSVTPKVGVVIAKGEEVLAEGFRGEDRQGKGDHAEFIALGKIDETVDLSDAEVLRR